MQTKSDAQLLREYVEQGCEKAFGEIVGRYADLVYSAALRQVGSPDEARDIAQIVFTDLVRKASSLRKRLKANDSLVGWLYRGTRYASLNVLRSERRRQFRETHAMQYLHPAPDPTPDWERIGPVLDEAIARLSDADRNALLLRFFKNQDFRAVGAVLGVSDDAAQKRVTRSLEKLREALLRRGITTTAPALVFALSANAVQSAPAGLVAALTTASLATATATGTAFTCFQFMVTSKLQTGILAAVVIASIGTPLLLQQQAQARLREKAYLHQEQRTQLSRLAAENNNLSNLLAGPESSASAPSDEFRDLLTMRGEVARLRTAVQQLAQAKANPLSRNEKLALMAQIYTGRVEQVRQLFEANPSEKIPELQYLPETEWLRKVSQPINDSEEGYRKAMASTRNAAVIHFGIDMLFDAVQRYARANNRQFPTEVSQLRPYFKSPVDDAVLQRWEVLPASKLPQSQIRDKWVITPKAPINAELDQTFVCGLDSFMLGTGTNQWVRLP